MAISQTTLKLAPQTANGDASLDYACPTSTADVASVPRPRLVQHESDASSDYSVGEVADTSTRSAMPQRAVIAHLAEPLVTPRFPRTDEDASWDYAPERRALAS